MSREIVWRSWYSDMLMLILVRRSVSQVIVADDKRVYLQSAVLIIEQETGKRFAHLRLYVTS